MTIQSLEKRLESGDRTPTREALEHDVQALEEFVSNIQREIGFGEFDKKAIRQVLEYMDEHYSDTDGNRGTGNLKLQRETGVMGFGYEVSWPLIREQVAKDLPDITDVKLAMDALYGKLQYNPGSAHAEMREESLKKYIAIHGEKTFRETIEPINTKVFELHQQGKEVVDDMNKEGMRPQYNSMFTQYFDKYQPEHFPRYSTDPHDTRVGWGLNNDELIRPYLELQEPPTW